MAENNCDSETIQFRGQLHIETQTYLDHLIPLSKERRQVAFEELMRLQDQLIQEALTTGVRNANLDAHVQAAMRALLKPGEEMVQLALILSGQLQKFSNWGIPAHVDLSPLQVKPTEPDPDEPKLYTLPDKNGRISLKEVPAKLLARVLSKPQSA